MRITFLLKKNLLKRTESIQKRVVNWTQP